MKRSFSTLLVLAACVAFGQDLDQKVEYRTVAAPVGRVLADIAKLTKVNVQAAPTMANEIIVIGVKDMPLRQLLKRIAEVTTGRWDESAERMALVRDTATMRAQEDAEYRIRLGFIQKEIKELVASLSPKKAPPKTTKPKTEAEEMAEDMQDMMTGGVDAETPSGRAIIKLVQALGATPFANIGKDDRVVFATTPTRMQRVLPSSAPTLLEQLVREQNEYAKKQASLPTEEESTGDPEMDKRLKEFAARFSFGNDNSVIDRPAVKAILIAEREGFNPNVQLSLRLYDEKGSVMLNGSGYLSVGEAGIMDDFMPTLPGQEGEKKPAKQYDPKEKEIEFSPLVKDRMSLKFDFSNPAAMPTMSPALREALLHPETTDPLAYQESESLLETAKAKGLNVIANLPDGSGAMGSMFSGMAMMEGVAQTQKLTPSRYYDTLLADKDLKIVVEGTEMTIRPTAPALSRKTRLNRAALGTLIRAAEAKGSAGLDDIAAYAVQAEPPFETPAAMTYLMFFAPNAMSNGMSGMLDWNLLRLYGGLSADQKQGLVSGRRIPYGQLSTTQQGLVTRMVFGAGSNLNVDRPGEKKADDEDMFGLMFGAMMGRSGPAQDYRDEPTELMPNGVLPQAFLQIDAIKGYAVYPADKLNPMFGMGALGAEELSLFAWMKEEPMFQEASGFMPTLNNVKLGSRLTLNVKIQLAEAVNYKGTLRDDRLEAGAKAVPMGQLPADLLADVEKRKEKLKKMGLPFGRPDQNGPPPKK